MRRLRPLAGIRGKGRCAAAFLLFLALVIPASSPAARAKDPGSSPEVVVTEIFVDSRSDVDAAFLSGGGREEVAAGSGRLVALLSSQEGWRVHPDFMADPASTAGSLAQAGERVYVRGVITRADTRQTRLFAGLELWTFTVGLRLECFDIRSGQVWFGQEATVRLPVESASTPTMEQKRQFFSEAFQAALEHAARRTGAAYQPGNLEAVLTGRTQDSLWVVDRGARNGLVAGATAQVLADGQQWLLRLQEVQGPFSLARVVASTTPDGPPLGKAIAFAGVNSLMALDGPPIAVAGAAIPRSGLDPAFDVDAATLGQWLHDGLVDTRAFNMLPPLLCGSDTGASELAAAFFRSQAVFSAAGDVRQSEVVGHRSLPQVLARLSLAHAQLTRSTRLGYQAQELRLGMLLEIYDRRTHEVLLSVTHEGAAMEKQHERYRQVDLANAWRELARSTVLEAARLAAAGWSNKSRDLPLEAVDGNVLRVGSLLERGERGEVLRPGERMKDRQGRDLGPRLGSIALAQASGGTELRLLAATDGNPPRPGDLLRLPGPAGRPHARIRQVQVGGEKVLPGWEPDPLHITLWTQEALGVGARFNLLAPEMLAAEVAAAEVALAGGEFSSVPLGEILLADPPLPQVLVDVRVGLGRWERKATPYKAELSFITGVELSFYSAQGEALPLFKGRDGQPTHQVKKAWTETEEQVLADGQVVQGLVEEDFPRRLDACLRTCLMQLGADLAAPDGSK